MYIEEEMLCCVASSFLFYFISHVSLSLYIYTVSFRFTTIDLLHFLLEDEFVALILTAVVE